MTKVTHLTLDEKGSLSRKRIHLREISGEADAPLETVGQDLRAARLRRGDDLATVSRALKIRKDHLEALEEDRFEALPGRAYAVGFVRSYADYLGLDPLQSVERFKVEIAGRAETTPTVGPAPETETVRLPQGWIIMGVVAVFVVVWVAYHLARSADTLLRQQTAATTQAPPVAPVIVPPHRAVQTAPAVVSPKPPQTATALVGPAPNTTPGLPAANPAAGTPNPPPGATAAFQPGAPVVATPLPPGHAYGDAGHDVRVVLRAAAVTRILVQGADGKVLENRTLQPGDSYNVPNKVGLTLTTPNGGAIGLELDGQPMGYASKGARMTEALSLDPQAIVDRYNHSNSGGGVQR
jgi:cytoskeleton protein RodZ